MASRRKRSRAFRGGQSRTAASVILSGFTPSFSAACFLMTNNGPAVRRPEEKNLRIWKCEPNEDDGGNEASRETVVDECP